ncbi:MAG TPA: hypothetical protein VIH42_09820 [Thermoguttaceae bacterium]
MIDIKLAVKKALDYVAELFPVSTFSELRLEEVELTEDDKNWLITVSFIRKTSLSSISDIATVMAELHGNYDPSDREYKLITIDAETGKPRSMKIRQLV